MSLWATLTRREQPPAAAPVPAVRRQRFAVGSDYETWTALVGNTLAAGRVSRAEASRVPAVKRARDLIAGVIGTLPLHAVNAAGEQVTHALLDQPERLSGLVRSVTIARTVEDLLYDAASLWLVVLRTSAGFPAVVERVEFGRWSQDSDSGKITVNGREVDTADVILFTSPCDPLLVAGAPAIRNLLALERTASLYADSPEAAEYFTPTDGDPADDADVERLLADWRDARRTRSTAYVPAAVTLNKIDRMTAEELQLISAREFAVTEVARLTGIDADWLSVNTTSRTYANAQDARRSFVDFVLAPYIHAIEERLSLGDCTPRGQAVKFNLDGFLRASTLERYQAHAVALSAGFLTVDEVRALEDRPPLGDIGGIA
jgi:hypothetical protein